MDNPPEEILTPEQAATLTELAETENARLEEAASQVTQQAFNLGCAVGLLPGAIVFIVALLLTGFSVIAVALSVVLITTGLIAFANLAAMLARRNTIRRVYREQSQGQLEQKLCDNGFTRSQFDQVARQVLPPQAALYSFLTTPPVSTNKPNWIITILKRKENDS
jgi:hypothetical protein